MSDREQDNDVVDPLGRPKLHPTDPDNDPDAPDPAELVPGRPGAPSDLRTPTPIRPGTSATSEHAASHAALARASRRW